MGKSGKNLRKSSNQISKKKSPNRERAKNRSATVQVDSKKSRRTNSNMSNGSSSGSKKKKQSATTDDYVPQRGRDRANSKRKASSCQAHRALVGARQARPSRGGSLAQGRRCRRA